MKAMVMCTGPRKVSSTVKHIMCWNHESSFEKLQNAGDHLPHILPLYSSPPPTDWYFYRKTASTAFQRWHFLKAITQAWTPKRLQPLVSPSATAVLSLVSILDELDLTTKIIFYWSNLFPGSCLKNTCNTLCIPRGSSDYVCPPVTGKQPIRSSVRWTRTTNINFVIVLFSGISSFLFFTKYCDSSSIKGFSVDSGSNAKSAAFPLGLSASWITHSAYYYKTDSIFWVDSISEFIMSARRDNTHRKTLMEGVPNIGGFSLDWIAGTFTFEIEWIAFINVNPNRNAFNPAFIRTFLTFVNTTVQKS